MHPKTCCVKVENIAECVNHQDIVALFRTLIGKIRKCEHGMSEGAGRYLELAFNTPDAAKKALCMSGYNVAGVPLLVAAIPASQMSSQSKRSDSRRNLYVLGLPIDLTKSEFISIFSCFGKVSHCVILATVDNASRRRGFVVMSTHEEARLAMSRLTRTDVKGYTIDVSWAVVQRSRGFLDGGDRTMMLNPRYEPSDFTISDSSSIAPDSFMATSDDLNSSISGANNLFSASAILLVKNLPALLFSEPSDLDPLMRPFGSIQTMQVLNSEADRTSPLAVTSAVVEYKTLVEAQEAKSHLHGQVYAGLSLEVEYMQAGVPLEPSQLGSWRSSYKTTLLSSSGQMKRSSPLNPFAAPFVAEPQIDLFAPGSGFGSNPNSSFNPAVFYPQTLELKPYHQAAMSPTEPSTKTHAQDQDLYPYQCQTQYPANAISIQPFSYPHDASYYKTLDRNFSTGFISNSVNFGWNPEHHPDSQSQDVLYSSANRPYPTVYV